MEDLDTVELKTKATASTENPNNQDSAAKNLSQIRQQIQLSSSENDVCNSQNPSSFTILFFNEFHINIRIHICFHM